MRNLLTKKELKNGLSLGIGMRLMVGIENTMADLDGNFGGMSLTIGGIAIGCGFLLCIAVYMIKHILTTFK
ncbi:MAG: hypothetical protein E6423_10940 [Clostridium sp.]|nr:hypothetical protein [Clostridium sp.]